MAGEHGILSHLLLLLAASLPLALALRRIGQSTIVAYLITGLVIGPGGLRLIGANSIDMLAEIGVGLLLFAVGIELSFGRLVKVRRIALGGGALQVGVTALVTAAAIYAATGRLYEGIFLGCAVALSSSAIILKTLADRGDLDAPYTNAATGVAIFQDLATVPMLVVLPALGVGASAAEIALPALLALVKAGALLVLLAIAGRYIDRFLYGIARARSPEIFVVSIMVLLLAAAYASQLTGLPLALGAFLAGVLLADSDYAHQILADVTPFKGVFQAIFFVSIGMLLDPVWVLRHPWLTVGAAAAVIVGKVLIAGFALWLVGVPSRVAASTAIVLAQVGEFSFVLIALGRRQGAISDDLYQLALAASFVSMAVAPLLIANVRSIVNVLAYAPVVGHGLSGGAGRELSTATEKLSGHVIIGGFGPVGRDVATFLLDHGFDFVALELNPRTVKDFSEQGIPMYFGDFSNAVVLEQAGIARARAFVVAAPDHEATQRAVRVARDLCPELQIIARTKYRSQVGPILSAGANEVIEEEFETALEMVARLVRALDLPRRVVAEHMAGQRLERYARTSTAEQPAGVVGESSVRNFEIEVVLIPDRSPLVGKTLAEADIRGRAGATVVAIGRGNEQIVSPPATFALAPRDRVACVGTAEQLEAVTKLAKGGNGPG